MHTREINVFLIGSPQVHKDVLATWLGSHGVKDVDAVMKNLETIPDGEALVAMAAKRCYLSFETGLNPNVTRIRQVWHEYFENLLKSGHGSVLEHGMYTFAIENVTRVFTGEMNRHRAGVAISEGSMRYIRFDDIPFWMPYSLDEADYDSDDLKMRKHKTKEVFKEVFSYIENVYHDLVRLWDIDKMSFEDKKKVTSLLRRLIPMGVCTGGVWSMNLRALRHIIALRSSPAAEEEIAHVASEMARIMLLNAGHVFSDFDKVGKSWVPKYPKV